MKVYDCFTFFNELDLLEIRLNELDEIVDYFVIVEGKKTFQNNSKPLYLLENIDRFEKFKNKIIRIEISEEEFTADPWSNESYSWCSIIKGLKNAQEDDIIIVSALDEIPKKETINDIIYNLPKPCCVITQFYYFYLNTKYYWDPNYQTDWPGSYVTTFDKLDKNNIYNFVHLRKDTYKTKGGWHFSFLGDANNTLLKVHSYGHFENNHFTKEFYEDKIQNLKDVFNRPEVGFHSYDDISNLPQYVQDNMDKFKKYIRI
jgi:beta-1,4-mannosyl-glycoprotein beta-1,4-N-acetylglucosaminyltransferase